MFKKLPSDIEILVIDTYHWKYLTPKKIDVKFLTLIYTLVNSTLKPNIESSFAHYYKASNCNFRR